MFRRIARMISVADVIGLVGLLVVAFGAYQIDPRLVPFVIGVPLILLAVSLSREEAVAEEPRALPRIPGESLEGYRRRAAGE